MAHTKRSLRQFYPKRIEVPFAILLTSLLLISGLAMPVLTVQNKLLFWEEGNTFSILSGVLSLFRENHYFLATFVFFFSVIFPLGKLLTLLTIWMVKLGDFQRETMLRWLEALGKWSMLDVFVVAVLVVVVKLDSLANATPRNGIYIFAVAILLSMALTFYIDKLARQNPS
jgi:paraquat-inducible protein A